MSKYYVSTLLLILLFGLQLAQSNTDTLPDWIAIGGIKITDKNEIGAILTASYSRTPAEVALLENITQYIIDLVIDLSFYTVNALIFL